MEWDRINHEVIEVPATVMKMKKPYRVLLTNQLRSLLDNRPHIGKFVFPLPKGSERHLRIEVLGLFVRRHGLRDILVPHGTRAFGEKI